MKVKIKSLLCTVLVIAVILGTLTFASAGTTGYFNSKPVNNTYYSYLAGSTKSTTNGYGTATITAVNGGSYATIRGGTASASATAHGVSTGSVVSVNIPAAYRIKGDMVALYGQGITISVKSMSGSWNAN